MSILRRFNWLWDFVLPLLYIGACLLVMFVALWLLGVPADGFSTPCHGVAHSAEEMDAC